MLAKLLSWLPKNLATILGVVQAFIKLVKEILTGIVNLLYPVIPNVQFQAIVDTVRSITNKVDDIVEKAKNWALNLGL